MVTAPPKRKRRVPRKPRGTGTARFYYKGSRVKQLRAFLYTAKLGTLSRAAEALFLSQPSVSLQIQALEREFGVRLLERSGRRVQLTREGQELFDLARPLIEGLEALDQNFKHKVQGLDAGELNVAAGSSTIQLSRPASESEAAIAQRDRHGWSGDASFRPGGLRGRFDARCPE